MTVMLYVGSAGQDVERWQRIVGVTPDGIYGPTTERATRIWQLAVCRQATGVVSTEDWALATTDTDEPGAVWIAARHHGERRRQDPRIVVLHCTQGDDVQGSARAVGEWWHGPESPKTSAHYVVDSWDTVQCVREHDVAWTAGARANGCGVHVEIVGRYPTTDWATSAAMARAAILTRHICERHTIPLAALGIGELLDDRRGIVTHDTVRRAWHQTTHVDPGGPGDRLWPWERFLAVVREEE